MPLVSPALETAMKPRILVVDDEAPIREMLREFLGYEGYSVEVAEDGADALARLRSGGFDLVLTDMKMPTVGGLELLREIAALRSPVTTVLMTGYGTVDTAISAMKTGAYDYILKPFKLKDVTATLARAWEKVRLERENVALRGTLSLYRLSEATTSCDSLDSLFEIYCAIMLDELRADLVLHYMARADGTQLGLADFGAGFVVIEEDLYRFAESLSADRLLASFARRDPVLLHGDDAASAFGRTLGTPVRSLLAVPLAHQSGRVVGMTVVASVDAAHAFAEGHRKLAQVFANTVADAVERTRLYGEIDRNRRHTLTGLANVLMTKDPYIRHHSESVRRLALATCRAMGLSAAEAEVVGYGALLHDIGKIGIKLEKLHQRERLTTEDYRMFQAHPDAARFILEPLAFLADITPIVYHHHERWDGRGYPAGLKAEEIPLGARIVSVCDAYDAITSRRVYVRDTSHETALGELRRNAGTQFDPGVVRDFCSMIDEYRATEGDYHEQVARAGDPRGEAAPA